MISVCVYVFVMFLCLCMFFCVFFVVACVSYVLRFNLELDSGVGSQAGIMGWHSWLGQEVKIRFTNAMAILFLTCQVFVFPIVRSVSNIIIPGMNERIKVLYMISNPIIKMKHMQKDGSFLTLTKF